MGIVIRTEMNPETGQQVMDEINPEGDEYTLEELYEICGCQWIQVLRIQVDGLQKIMILDEEGQMNRKQPNKAATEVLWEGNPEHRGFTVLLGNVAIIDDNQLN